MNQIERLKEIFIKNENKGIAIAITGSWGIGKTFFWNEFIKERIKQEKREREKYYYKATLIDKKAVFDKRYSYVSLFGIETLSDLKTKIYTQLSGHHFSEKEQPKFEVPRWVKAIASGLKEEKISQLGFSASMRFFDSMLFAQVKEAIICFDDFERMSNKLDIKDVMGLANQLKLEKNCQIILILDEDKAEGENKKKYAEYKEKLIDETIIINSVEPLIRANAQDMDERLIKLMVKFADELEIHNFRFFQKIIKLYKKFRERLPIDVAYATSEIILVRILQGYFIEDFGGRFDFEWNDVTFLGFESDKERWTERKQKTYKIIENSMPFYFFKLDNWALEFKSWFSQEKDFDDNLIQELVIVDLFDENYQKANEKIEKFIRDYKAFDIELDFSKKLGAEIKKILQFETLDNIEFYCSILSEFDETDQIAEIDYLMKSHLKSGFISNRTKFLEKYYWHGNKNNKFRKYIKELLDSPIYFQQDDFVKIVRLFIDRGEIAYGTEEVLSHLTKNNFENFILDEYPKNFKSVSLKVIIEVIVDLYSHQKLNNKENIQIWSKEIIEELGKKRKFPEHYIKKFTEDL
jgi:hypothetical protein